MVYGLFGVNSPIKFKLNKKIKSLTSVFIMNICMLTLKYII